MRRTWDISQTIRPSLPVWPGEPSFSMQRTAEITDDCPVNVSTMTLSTHAGTHADSPLHYYKDGMDSEQSPLEPYIGPCQVIDARHSVGNIKLNEILDIEIKASRVLFRTYNSFPHDHWSENFTAISTDVVKYLGSNNVVLIGTDTPSLDPQDSKTLNAHHAVKQFDMRILEGLVLDEIEDGVYELVALPLKIRSSDSSPVRAILREI